MDHGWMFHAVGKSVAQRCVDFRVFSFHPTIFPEDPEKSHSISLTLTFTVLSCPPNFSSASIQFFMICRQIS